MKFFSRKSAKGFTLIELLAVIAIIAILAALGLVAYSSAQRNARNAKRVGDLKSMQNAAEQYAANNGGSYGSWTGANSMAALLTGGSLPLDPTTDSPYNRHTDLNTNTYCVCAQLEPFDSSTKAAGNSTSVCSPGPAWSQTGGTHFCVTNQQ